MASIIEQLRDLFVFAYCEKCDLSLAVADFHFVPSPLWRGEGDQCWHFSAIHWRVRGIEQGVHRFLCSSDIAVKILVPQVISPLGGGQKPCYN